MRSVVLHELLEGWVADLPAVNITGISLDSQSIEVGDVFVAVKCQQNHGLDFAHEAVAAGAVAVIHDGRGVLPDLQVACVEIDGLENRLGELASRFFAAPSEQMNIVGITGSSGMTSVAHYLAQSWQRVDGNAGLVSALGCGPFSELKSGIRTLPDAFRLQGALSECLKAGVEQLAMEVSSYSLQQQNYQTVQFKAAVLTTLSRGHFGGCGGMAASAAANRLLFTECAPSFAIINHDDEFGKQWFNELNGCAQVFSFGLNKGAELKASVRFKDMEGMTIRIDGPWGSETIRTSLTGESNVSNLLATAGTLVLLGMPWHRVLHQLEMMQPVPGSMSRISRIQGQAVIAAENEAGILEVLEDAA